MRSNAALWILIGTTILWLLLGAAAIIPAMFSVMMFDAPGSEKNVALITLAAALMSFPLVCTLAVILSWVLYVVRAPTPACVVALLPLVNILIGAAALTWILFVQDGQFAP